LLPEAKQNHTGSSLLRLSKLWFKLLKPGLISISTIPVSNPEGEKLLKAIFLKPNAWVFLFVLPNNYFFRDFFYQRLSVLPLCLYKIYFT